MRKLKIDTLMLYIEEYKENINVIKLDNKDENYILYSGENIDDNTIDKTLFKRLEFNETISITPKAKFNSLGLNTIYDKNTNLYKLYIKNMPIYYSFTNKPIINNQLKLILNNGTVYSYIKKNTPTNNLIDDILNKNNNNNIKSIIINNNIETNSIIDNKDINNDINIINIVKLNEEATIEETTLIKKIWKSKLWKK